MYNEIELNKKKQRHKEIFLILLKKYAFNC